MTRLFDRLEQLYALGDKIGYSPAEDEAHRLARGWLEEAGLTVEVDDAGNLLGRSGEADDVWTGSHLDSVPSGGKFDGMLGVVAGIEAVERTGRGAVVVFRDEERGCAGSRARVASGNLPRRYLELHVEQGPRLDRAGAPLGVVIGIVGYARGDAVVEGTAGHAGTTPMDFRDDALVKALRAILRLEEEARRIPEAVATVGRIEAEPGGTNVIPGRVTYSVDVRAPDQERLDALIEIAGIDDSHASAPVAMSPLVVQALRAEIEERRRPVVELVSGAGHDAGVLAAAGVESGMLFVRSLNGGVSHSPDELSSEEDVALAVDVLTATLERLTAPGS